MQKLDGILERDDVLVHGPVDVPDHGRHRRALPATRDPRDKDQPPLVLGYFIEDEWKLEIGERRNLDRDDPRDDSENTALLMDVDAETSKPGKAPGTVVVLDLVDALPVTLVGNELDGQLAHLIVGDLLLSKRNQLSVQLRSNKIAGLDMDITCPILDRLLEHLIHQRRTLGMSSAS
jgi:hypothetical protein